VGRIARPCGAPLPACQSAAGPDRDADRAVQAGQATLGRAEDTRAAGPALSGCPHPGDPMPAFLSGPGPRPTPTPACRSCHPLKLFFVPRPRRRVCALLSCECAIAARHEPEGRTMWYRKNVGGWERAARLIGGGLMLICGVVALHNSPLGLLLSGAGVVTLVTGVFSYCPACAIAGREPLKG